ncbi:MAG: DUF1015 family protein [Kiritimatiellae bacterium]|nr:DUF1015 family protein [Kiritimatiellia bacterium]
MRVKPFRALRPAAGKAERVAAVPYDVVDTDEARALAVGNPESFLHVSRPEIDLPDNTDLHSDAVYAQGARALRAFQETGVLIREDKDCLYVYRQVMAAHSQVGVVVCSHIQDYADNLIRKHEKTRQDKEDDRTRHVLTMNANSGPVFLTYRDTSALEQLIAGATGNAPLYDFTAFDGVQHTLWKVSKELERWVDAFNEVPLAYVADGHHRAAAAFRAGAKRREQNPAHDGSEEYNWFLTVLFPASQLKILPYNRCVQDLNGLSAAEYLERVKEIFKVQPTQSATPTEARGICMYLAGSWYQLSWDEFDSDPVGILDVSVLQERLLAPLLGVDDPRTNQRISFIGGIRGTAELTKLVDSGRAAVAFSMRPCSIQQMMNIADADQVMPPKSTWFEPKLRSGLIVHTLD